MENKKKFKCAIRQFDASCRRDWPAQVVFISDEEQRKTTAFDDDNSSLRSSLLGAATRASCVATSQPTLLPNTHFPLVNAASRSLFLPFRFTPLVHPIVLCLVFVLKGVKKRVRWSAPRPFRPATIYNHLSLFLSLSLSRSFSLSFPPLPLSSPPLLAHPLLIVLQRGTKRLISSS